MRSAITEMERLYTRWLTNLYGGLLNFQGTRKDGVQLVARKASRLQDAVPCQADKMRWRSSGGETSAYTSTLTDDSYQEYLP